MVLAMPLRHRATPGARSDRLGLVWLSLKGRAKKSRAPVPSTRFTSPIPDYYRPGEVL